MATDPRLAGYLTRALNHEMAAVQQYLSQSALAGLWGMVEHGNWFRGEALEELGHAERLIRHMLMLGIPAHATQLASARPGRTLQEMLLIDRMLEIEAIRLYEEATHYCARMRDGETQTLFADLLQDELGHLRELDRRLTDIHQGATP